MHFIETDINKISILRLLSFEAKILLTFNVFKRKLKFLMFSFSHLVDRFNYYYFFLS